MRPCVSHRLSERVQFKNLLMVWRKQSPVAQVLVEPLDTDCGERRSWSEPQKSAGLLPPLDFSSTLQPCFIWTKGNGIANLACRDESSLKSNEILFMAGWSMYSNDPW